MINHTSYRLHQKYIGVLSYNLTLKFYKTQTVRQIIINMRWTLVCLYVNYFLMGKPISSKFHTYTVLLLVIVREYFRYKLYITFLILPLHFQIRMDVKICLIFCSVVANGRKNLLQI